MGKTRCLSKARTLLPDAHPASWPHPWSPCARHHTWDWTIQTGAMTEQVRHFMLKHWTPNILCTCSELHLSSKASKHQTTLSIEIEMTTSQKNDWVWAADSIYGSGKGICSEQRRRSFLVLGCDNFVCQHMNRWQSWNQFCLPSCYDHERDSSK